MKQRGIVIVDDEEGYAAIPENRLKLREFSFISINDDVTAIDIIENLSFSWIILDLGLPDIHGSKVLFQIKTLARKTCQ